MRIVIFGALALTLASAFLLYGSNYDTRLLEARVQDQERDIEEARGDIAVLKAERAHLGRPDRIEPLARAQGLGPATERQLAARPEEALARILPAKDGTNAQAGARAEKGN